MIGDAMLPRSVVAPEVWFQTGCLTSSWEPLRNADSHPKPHLVSQVLGMGQVGRREWIQQGVF